MYDVVVVGARCAGAPTAMLLARRGYDVLLLDRASFPSDQPMSTHLIYPPGVLRLDRWGLLDAVRGSGCPPVTLFGLRKEPIDILSPSLPAEHIAEGYAPRRYVLDTILLEAARAAGVTVLERTSVRDLVRDPEGTVLGVRAGRASGSDLEADARIVVGADGTNSVVARLAGAEEYRSRPRLLGNYWAYWRDTGQHAVLSFAGHRLYSYAWPTNDNCTLVGVAWPMDDYRALGADLGKEYFAALEILAPELAATLKSCERSGEWMRGSVRNFLRKPFGPGWALVGDAGYSKDPCTAAGITDAFCDVEVLVEAIDDGLSGRRDMATALAGYEEQRNERVIPFYDFICDFAELHPFPQELWPILKYIESDPEESMRIVGLFTQTLSPRDFYSEENMLRILALAGIGEPTTSGRRP